MKGKVFLQEAMGKCRTKSQDALAKRRIIVYNGLTNNQEGGRTDEAEGEKKQRTV